MTTRNLYLIALTSLSVSIITTIIYGTYGPIRAVLHIIAGGALIVATWNKAWRKK